MGTCGDVSGALGYCLQPGGDTTWTSWRGGRELQIQVCTAASEMSWGSLYIIADAPKEICTEEITVEATGL